MRAHRIEREHAGAVPLEGWILSDEVRDEHGRTALRKGHVLGPADRPVLDRLPWRELHVIEPEATELHEEEAGRRIAAAVTGAGAEVRGFSGGHWAIAATARGMLEIAIDALRDVNRVDGACVYSSFDGQIVEAGEVVARAKITPFVLAEERVREVERVARSAGGIVRVARFEPKRIAAVVQERVSDESFARFRSVLGEKLSWLGAELVAAHAVRADAAAVGQAIRAALAGGAEVMVMAGTKAMDPLDPAFVALEALGARLERYGVPVHPGSLFWVARLGDVPVLGMPTCGLFSKATSFDLVLPRLLAGRRIDHDSLAELGHGGLLSSEMRVRFPPYRRDQGRGEVE